MTHGSEVNSPSVANALSHDPGPTSREHFEAVYHRSVDPWNFATSEYEQRRYDRVIAALGDQRFSRGFEPGCSVGVLTAMLASRCDDLLATDIASAAVAIAADRCRDQPTVRLRQATLPDDLPAGRFDLMVFCEIGYYFTNDVLVDLADRLIDRLQGGGLLVASHWSGHSRDHLLAGAQVHDVLRRHPGLSTCQDVDADGFVFGAWSRR